jgi:hypothetical protein
MDDTKKTEALARKCRKRTSILNDEEVEFLMNEISLALGEKTMGVVRSLGLVPSDGVRWGSLQARCEEERERRGLSLKDVSRELKIPQYRLRAIEGGRLKELRPNLAHRYFRYLGIDSWVRRWSRANDELARRSGIKPFPRSRGDR